ncbi:LysM domain-containing protein [Candidatus Sororendozoicomonas aggregata]|uniref:LysM peptidoglycan-binding domain-containing protein n=1 Tax=Candidatus Sororendozoicomonas aggregata TaxID=3073239 RepID=UPI002ED6341B
MRRTVIATSLLLLTFFVSANESPLRGGVDGSYTVKKGDTLWKVAEYFLRSPWRWQELWMSNPHIRNPHLIFPGDIISLVYIDGQPKLTVSRRGDVGRTFKLSPKIRTTPIEKAIPAISISLINKFLRTDRVFLLEEELSRAPYIFAFPNDRIAGSTGDLAYSKGLDVTRGRYEIVRPGQEIREPFTKELLGVMGYKVAEADIKKMERGVGVLKITGAQMAVKKGDRVMDKDTFTPVTTFFPKSPYTSVDGKVLAVVSGGKKAGKYDTVIISLGERDKMRPGDVLSIYESKVVEDTATREKHRIPSRELGMVMIYRPFEKVSYGIVMSAMEDVQIGDFLTNP